MQYSIRNVPAELDRRLKALARDRGVSLNELALEALAAAVEAPRRYRDLGALPGTPLTPAERRAIDGTVTELRVVDAELWR